MSREWESSTYARVQPITSISTSMRRSVGTTGVFSPREWADSMRGISAWRAERVLFLLVIAGGAFPFLACAGSLVVLVTINVARTTNRCKERRPAPPVATSTSMPSQALSLEPRIRECLALRAQTSISKHISPFPTNTCPSYEVLARMLSIMKIPVEKPWLENGWAHSTLSPCRPTVPPPRQKLLIIPWTRRVIKTAAAAFGG